MYLETVPEAALWGTFLGMPVRHTQHTQRHSQEAEATRPLTAGSVATCYALGCGGVLSDTAIRPFVCPSPRRAAALGYRHAGCLQLSHVRIADPSADGRRSAASETAIGWGISSRRTRGDNLL